MASVRQIAEQTGVSITTVSRVLNNHPAVSSEVRKRVMDAANREGYVAKVGRRSTSNIAVLYTGDASINSPFDSALLYGITDVIQDTPFDLMILDARRSRQPTETYSQMFMRKGVRGVIIRTSQRSRHICEEIAREHFPAVVVGTRFEDSDVNYVYSDSRPASREAIEHLISLGHRQIAISANVVDDTDHQDRIDAYREILEESGIGFDRKLVWRIPATRLSGEQLVKRLTTGQDRPTAIYITDPITAALTMIEAQKSELKVPNDLSLVGFDDYDERTKVFPLLTSVCQNAEHLGEEAFGALLRIMSGRKKESVHLSLRTWLEVGDSTGPPRR